MIEKYTKMELEGALKIIETAVEIFNIPETWCQGSKAKNIQGNAVNAHSDEAREFSIEGVLEKDPESLKYTEISKELISLFSKEPVFLLDMWNDQKDQTQDKMLQILISVGLLIKKTIQKMNKPDDLEDILNNKKDFGCVFLPLELLKRIWKLGDVTSKFLQKPKNQREEEGKIIQFQMLEIMEDSRKWVKYCQTRWGNPPNSESVPIVPMLDVPF